MVVSLFIVSPTVIMPVNAVMGPSDFFLDALTNEWHQGSFFSIGNLFIFGFSFFMYLVAAFFHCGLIAMYLKIARRDSPRLYLYDLFSGRRWVFKMFGFYILIMPIMMLIMWKGTLLLIVPGLIAGFILSFAPYFIVDQNMGPIKAIVASFRAAKDNFVNLLALALLSGLIGAAGILPFGVGMLIALPLIQLAVTLAYLHISGRLDRRSPANC
ncbi:MAG: hypothetical protein FWD73_03880 [Polyangiaceae bacterium]|nr:hypothetical protein [Polyangiaceae bacterium]